MCPSLLLDRGLILRNLVLGLLELGLQCLLLLVACFGLLVKLLISIEVLPIELVGLVFVLSYLLLHRCQLRASDLLLVEQLVLQLLDLSR